MAGQDPKQEPSAATTGSKEDVVSHLCFMPVFALSIVPRPQAEVHGVSYGTGTLSGPWTMAWGAPMEAFFGCSPQTDDLDRTCITSLFPFQVHGRMVESP